jgi:beta-lactam-binding protein with PASTA domain
VTAIAAGAAHSLALVVPPPCMVPKVVGKKISAAKLAIAKRHCRTGKVGYAYSRKHTKGIVISQSRRPGRVLPAGSKIDLVVSRGRKR